jgi:hypothetical protein
MSYISHARRREVTRQAGLHTFPTQAAATPQPAEQNRQLCQVVLDAVQQSSRSSVLWRLLDTCPALVPQMVGVLDEEGEADLLGELMHRYFPDE